MTFPPKTKKTASAVGAFMAATMSFTSPAAFAAAIPVTQSGPSEDEIHFSSIDYNVVFGDYDVEARKIEPFVCRDGQVLRGDAIIGINKDLPIFEYSVKGGQSQLKAVTGYPKPMRESLDEVSQFVLQKMDLYEKSRCAKISSSKLYAGTILTRAQIIQQVADDLAKQDNNIEWRTISHNFVCAARTPDFMGVSAVVNVENPHDVSVFSLDGWAGTKNENGEYNGDGWLNVRAKNPADQKKVETSAYGASVVEVFQQVGVIICEKRWFNALSPGMREAWTIVLAPERERRKALMNFQVKVISDPSEDRELELIDNASECFSDTAAQHPICAFYNSKIYSSGPGHR